MSNWNRCIFMTGKLEENNWKKNFHKLQPPKVVINSAMLLQKTHQHNCKTRGTHSCSQFLYQQNCSCMVALHYAQSAITITSTVTMIMPGHWNAKSVDYLILSPVPQWFNKNEKSDANRPVQLVYLTTSVMYMRSELVTEATALSIMTKHFYTCDGLCCRSTSCEKIMLTK
jgi:hypothetical protein